MATTEKIVQQILDDAESIVQEISSVSEKQAADLVTAAREAIASSAEAHSKELQAQAGDARRRILIAAEMTVRREALAKRQEILGEVYNQALERVYSLPEDDWASLIEKLVLEVVETGKEKVKFAAADMERGRKILPRLNKSVKAKGLPGELTVDTDPGSFRGGVVLIGTATEMNASFEALFRNLRNESETEVAAILFK